MKSTLDSQAAKMLVGVFFLLLCVLIYLPSFKLNFSLLDDGLTILNARRLISGLMRLDWNILMDVFLEPFNGRVRPVYWLIQSFFAYLSFYNSYLFHFFRFMLLLATLAMSYRFLEKLKIHYSIILFSMFVFVFNIQNFENYYRLGPVEPIIVFFFVIIFYLLFFGSLTKRNLLLLVFCNLLGGLTKENFFLIGFSLLPILFISISKGDNVLAKKVSTIVITSILVGGVVFLIKAGYPISGAYSSNYVINVSLILSNTISYLKMIKFAQTPVFELSVIYLVFVFCLSLKRGISKLNDLYLILFTLWLVFFFQLLAISPWKFVLNRYLALINMVLALIYAIVVNEIYVFMAKKIRVFNEKSVRYLFLIIIFTVLSLKILVRNFFAISNYQLYSKVDSEISYKSVKDLAQYVPNGSTVYVNYKKGDSNIEIYEETKWHLDLFYNRSDIKFDYLDDSNLCTKNPRYIFDRSSDRYLDESVFKQKENLSLVASGESIYRPINYGVVIRSFLDRYMYPDWNASYIFNWFIYLQKGGSCIEKS